MHRFELGDIVSYRNPRTWITEEASVIARTLEEHPRYDILSGGEVYANVPGTDLEEVLK